MTDYIPRNRRGRSVLKASHLTSHNHTNGGPAKFQGTVVDAEYRGTTVNGNSYYDVALESDGGFVSLFRTSPDGHVGTVLGNGVYYHMVGKRVELSVNPAGRIVGWTTL